MVVGQFVAELAPATMDKERSDEAQPAQMLLVRGERLTCELGDARLRAREVERVASRMTVGVRVRR